MAKAQYTDDETDAMQKIVETVNMIRHNIDGYIRDAIQEGENRNMTKEIREQLLHMAETDYRKFSASLIPGVENMLGIRLPELRTFAKQIAKEDWKKMLSEEDIYFEEKMLRGMVISYAVRDLQEAVPYIEAFIPLVDNWSVCDSVFSGMNVLEKDREFTWEWIQKYLDSGREFEVRTAIIIIMQHLLKTDENGKKMRRLLKVGTSDLEKNQDVKGIFVERALKAANREFPEGYYASMAAAWLVAEAFCTFPYQTMQMLLKNDLDKDTYNRAIQKIVESRIPEEEVKAKLRGMKRR